MPASELLCFTGLILFVIGLLNGFAIPKMRSPRLALSAHLTAVQCGTALIAFGFLWPHLAFWPGWATPLAHVVWASFYVLWLGLFCSGLWGTGKPLPIAGGAAQPAAPWQNVVVTALVAGSSVVMVVALTLVLVQWQWLG